MQILYNGSHEIGIKVESCDSIESIAAHTHFTTSELVDIVQDIADNDEMVVCKEAKNVK
jgi:hypothetical protein